MAFATAFSLAGCKNTKLASEQITDITEAFKSGDSELFIKAWKTVRYLTITFML